MANKSIRMVPKLTNDPFQNELKSNISLLKEKEESIGKSLDDLEKVDGIDVDEAVTTTAPLYRQ